MSLSVAGLGRLSRSASRVVAKAANGFHLMRIDGYSQTKMMLPGQKLSSQQFTVGGRSWSIDYYPNGRATSANSDSNATSVYLQLTDHDQHPQQARYKFNLLDHTGNAAYELPAETASFTSVHKVKAQPHINAYPHLVPMGSPAAVEEPGPGCGHEEFIGKEELERRREDLIRDDRIVIRCDVGVTQIGSSYLAQDELEEEEEEEIQEYEVSGYHGYHGYGAPGRAYVYGPPRRRLRKHRTDDEEYIKWCLTQEPGQSQGRRQGVAHVDHDYY